MSLYAQLCQRCCPFIYRMYLLRQFILDKSHKFLNGTIVGQNHHCLSTDILVVTTHPPTKINWGTYSYIVFYCPQVCEVLKLKNITEILWFPHHFINWHEIKDLTSNSIVTYTNNATWHLLTNQIWEAIIVNITTLNECI